MYGKRSRCWLISRSRSRSYHIFLFLFRNEVMQTSISPPPSILNSYLKLNLRPIPPFRGLFSLPSLACVLACACTNTYTHKSIPLSIRKTTITNKINKIQPLHFLKSKSKSKAKEKIPRSGRSSGQSINQSISGGVWTSMIGKKF